MLECVVNVSEGRPGDALAAITAAGSTALLDLHQDVHHNRAVLTLAGSDVEAAVRRVARAAVENVDLRAHQGVHPRIGVVDVVPFVPLEGSTIDDALWTELGAEFRDEQLLELTMLAGFYHTVSFLVNALRLPLEPYAARFPA